jgi:hypothetical protein
MTQVKTSTEAPSVSITNSNGKKKISKGSKSGKAKATVTNPSKDKALTKVNLAKNAAETTKAVAEREVKYAYPDDCKTAAKKKVFRRNARAAMLKFTKALEALKGSHKPEEITKRKELQAEKEKFVKDTYTGK